MRTLLFSIIFGMTLFILKGVVFGGYLDREYKDMDMDEDGSLNWKEFVFYEKSATPELFTKIDNNSSGRIEFGEWVTYQNKDYPFKNKYKSKKYHYRYKDYHSYPRYGFRFHFGHGKKGHHRGYGLHFRHRPYYRYGHHHYRYKHYYGHRHYGQRRHYR